MRRGLQGYAGQGPTGSGDRRPGSPVVAAVVGAGAAGTLTAIHLVDRAVRADRALDLILVDPRPEPGRGVAYATTDRRHLLNVPAGGMSALPDDPGHLVDWLRAHGHADATPADFVPRADYGRYLQDTLAEALRTAAAVTLEHRCQRVRHARPVPGGVHLALADGSVLTADAMVLAPGIFAPGTAWTPTALATSDRFVADPWAPGALERLASVDGDVLLVGTGLTMVDVALSLARPGRTLHAVSRRGRVPATHTTKAKPPTPAPSAQLAAVAAGRTPADLDDLRTLVRDTVVAAVRETGDWRPAFDTLRPLTAALWSCLGPDERADFLSTDAAWWDLHRHRMPPSTAAAVARMRADDSLRVGSDEVLAAEETGDGLVVVLASGRRLTLGAVVNCTGPQGDVRRVADPLIDDLLAGGTAVPGPLGLGLRTHGGRVVDASGAHDAPIWTLGAMRRGELFETTAVPEIRAQAAAVAASVAAELFAPAVPRAPRQARDVMGLPLTTTPEAAAAFNRGLDAVMRVQSGAAEAFTEAAALDPGFALAHGALAMLGHEGGGDSIDVRRSLDAARAAAREHGTDRERSLVAVVDARVRDCRGGGAAALVRHVHAHPRDVLAVSAAVPTIAFSGVTDVQQEAWDLVEGIGPSYAGHWWHRSLLAFVRQDQQRYDEAGVLSEEVLALEPAAGHAVHARTHVFYETGAHVAGLRWLDPWITTCGRQATHRAHFSWHAALHELSTGDTEAVRRRYAEQLAPPVVTGVRGLVDSASLLWRCELAGSWRGELPVADVLEHAGAELVERPETPFTAMHSAVALTAAGDALRLRRLRTHAAASTDPVLRSVVAPLCDGLIAVVEQRFDDAVRLIRPLLGRLTPIGGSLAQREVVEDTYLYALVGAGRCEEAVALIDARLDRRPSPLDLRRRTAAARAIA
jgi:uncharacterized NAD(P)/FAD-binding protein YdhS